MALVNTCKGAELAKRPHIHACLAHPCAVIQESHQHARHAAWPEDGLDVKKGCGVQAHGSSRVLTHAMWKRAMQALHVGIQAAACPGTIVPLQARLDLVSAISQMQVLLLPPCALACPGVWTQPITVLVSKLS